MTASDPWYVAAFQRDYPDVYPHRDLESARQEVRLLLSRGFAGRVLDLCCGFGRHSLALAESGAEVIGVDLSAELLQLARNLPGGGLLAGRLLRADARRLPISKGCFDALANLFTSFGYFGEEGDRQVLAEVARVLRPGGSAILDLMNPERVRAGLVPSSRTERDGMLLEERRSLEQGGRTVVKEVSMTRAGGEIRRWREEVRFYEAREVAELGAGLGLELVEVLGSFTGERFEAGSERQILHMRRS
jgi:SAM-dependent methyltransferase